MRRRIERMFEDVPTWRGTISAALATSSGLDDPSRIDAIRALEQLGSAPPTAAQARARRRARRGPSATEQAGRSAIPAAQQGRGVAAQVALGAGGSRTHRGQRHLGLARVVVTELPLTWSGVASRTDHRVEGHADRPRDRVPVPRGPRGRRRGLVAGDPARLERDGRSRAGPVAARPEAVPARPRVRTVARRRQRGGRPTRHAPAGARHDDVADRAAAGEGRRRGEGGAGPRYADCARAAGDPRSRGAGRWPTPWSTPILAGSRVRAPSRRSRSTSRLVMTDTRPVRHQRRACLRRRTTAPSPPSSAREIVDGRLHARRARVDASALRRSRHRASSWRWTRTARLFRSSPRPVHPSLRDRFCRTPWCDAPIWHRDHARAAASGGLTNGDNGQGLCEACNHAKQAPGWRSRPSPGAGPHTNRDHERRPASTYRSQAPPSVSHDR